MNEIQTKYFDLQFNKRANELFKVNADEWVAASHVPPQELANRLSDAAKKNAERVINAWIDAYIETVEKFDITPSTEDFHSLTLNLQAMARRNVDTFKRKIRTPFVYQSETWKEQCAELLTNEIDQIVGFAVPRLKYFIDERNLLKEMTFGPKLEPQEELIGKLLTSDQQLFLETYLKFQKEGQPASEKKVIAELTKKRGTFFRPEIPGAFFRDNKITILGLALLDPQHPTVLKVDKIIEGVREVLDDNPDVNSINSKKLSEVTGLSLPDVQAGLRELETFHGVFHHSGVTAENDGRAEMRLDEKAFADYMRYESLLSVLHDRASRKQATQVSEPAISNSSVYHIGGDYIAGDQHKLGDNISGTQIVGSTTQSSLDEKRKWSWGETIGFVSLIAMVIIAGLSILASWAVPEGRQYVCRKVGILCGTDGSESTTNNRGNQN